MQDTPGYYEEGQETEAILSFIDKGNADYMAADMVRAQPFLGIRYATLNVVS